MLLVICWKYIDIENIKYYTYMNEEMKKIKKKKSWFNIDTTKQTL